MDVGNITGRVNKGKKENGDSIIVNGDSIIALSLGLSGRSLKTGSKETKNLYKSYNYVKKK